MLSECLDLLLHVRGCLGDLFNLGLDRRNGADCCFSDRCQLRDVFGHNAYGLANACHGLGGLVRLIGLLIVCLGERRNRKRNLGRG